MLNQKLQPILHGTLIGVLSLYAFSNLSEKSILQKKYDSLLTQSRQIQTTLDTVQKQHSGLLLDLQHKEKGSQNFSDTLKSIKKENQSLQLAIQQSETRVSSIEEEKTYLEEMLINKTQQIELLKNQQQPSAKDASDSSLSTKQYNDELKRLNEQNRILQGKLDRLYKTTQEKMNEINIAKIALEETVSTAKKKLEDEWNTVNLGSVNANTAQKDTSNSKASPAPSKSQGHVLAVNKEHGFVVIDLGKVDNLPTDAMLQVIKNGSAVATLRVLEIRDVMAACNIKDLRDGQRIEINDPVSIVR